MHDLIIENVCIVDGTGADRFQGSVAVKDGRVVSIQREIGNGGGEAAAERINADGLVLAPGFVDPHTHYDAQVAWDSLLTCSPWHGVTTVVMGNCGVGVAPMRPEMREMAMWDLVNVEAIPFDVMQRGIDWTWETFPEYLDAISAKGLGINVSAIAPLTPIRQFAMGEAAFERAANEDEIAVMKQLLRDALAAGAVGLSTTALNNHLGFEGRPLSCRNASRQELAALCGVLRDAGRGSIEIALTQTQFGTISDGELDLLEFLLRESERPVTFLALINDVGEPESYLQAVESLGPLLDWRRAVPQITCQPLRNQFQMTNPFVLATLEHFAPVFNKTPEEQAALYASPSFRDSVRPELDERGIARAMVDRMRIAEAKSEPARTHAASGRRLEEIAAETGVHPLDLLLDLTVAEGPELAVDLQLANFEPEGVRNLLRDGRFMIGLSDGGAHVEQLCDAGYTTHLLGKWVREEQALSLEEAVRNITSIPADFWGIAQRGRIAEGAPADLVLFDPNTVGAEQPEYVNDLPGGARRFVAQATGVEATLVAGQVLYRDGEYQGGLPGEVLRNND